MTPPVTEYIYEGVYTDYSAYIPSISEVTGEIYTRLSGAPLSWLIPSTSYGELLPYGVFESTDRYYYSLGRYGLVTADGVIVADPVFEWISPPQTSDSWWARLYDNYGTVGMITPPVYLLKLPKSMSQEELDHGYYSYEYGYSSYEEDWDDKYYTSELTVKELKNRHNDYRKPEKYELLRAVCASDGSWISDLYLKIHLCDLTIMLIRDEYENDADIMDYSGKILFNTKSLPFYDRLPVMSINRYDGRYWLNERYGFCVNGYFMFRLIDGSVAFVNELTGGYTIVDYEKAEEFAAALPDVSAPESIPYQPDPYYIKDSKVFRNDGTLLFETDGTVYYMQRQNVFVIIESYEDSDYSYYTSFSIYNMDGICVFRLSLDRWRDD
jgi:hypothetical protein